MSKYLITGGAGFIGSTLAECLLERGDAVVSLDNFDGFYEAVIKQRNIDDVETRAKILKIPFEDARGDIRDGNFLDGLFENHRFDGVFHLAALAGVRPSLKNPVGFWDVNCTGTATLMERIKKSGIKKVVFASSSSVYGNCKTAPFSEGLDVGQPISPYAATKKAGELLCYNYGHLYSIHCICIRFFTVYGPRQRPDLAIHKFTRLIREGKPLPFFGDGSTERDYTFITDICDGVLRAMDYAETCPYDIINLGESHTISLSGLVALLEETTGQKASLEHLPDQPGDVKRTWADITRARERLGYDPKVGKEEGIQKFIRWFDEQEE